jgi:hypothetical protein
MNTQSNVTPETVTPETVTPETATPPQAAAVLLEATIDEAVGEAIDAEVSYVKTADKAAKTRRKALLAAAATVNHPLTGAMFDKLFAPDLTKGLKGSGRFSTAASVSVALNRSKVFFLAVNWDATVAQPRGGETFEAHLTRLRLALADACHADGTRVWDPATKRGVVPGSGAAPAAPEGEAPAAPEGEAPAAPEGETRHPMSAAKADDTGLDVRPALAAACILTGEDATKAHPTADLLTDVMANHRAAFVAWATAKTAPKADKVKAPAPAASAKALLDMANGSGRKAHAPNA